MSKIQYFLSLWQEMFTRRFILLLAVVNICENTTISPKPEGFGTCCHPASLPGKSDCEKCELNDAANGDYDVIRRWLSGVIDHGGIFAKFQSLPTIYQAVLNTVLTWAQQRVATPAARAFTSHLATLLPPPPPKCPLLPRPAVTNVLPPEEDVFEQLLSRDVFVENDSGASLLLTAFAQHVLLQLAYDDESALSFDASQIYGSTTRDQMALRTGESGKLKMLDDYPPTLAEAPVDMLYPPTGERTLQYFHLTGKPGPEMRKWAMGHPLLAASPLAFSVGVLWLREHNRLCDKLVSRHPDWSDQRLFDAARAIVTGKMMIITLREILPRLAGKEFYPFDSAFPDKFTVENVQLLPKTSHLAAGLLWTWQLPDSLSFSGTGHLLSDLLFTDYRFVQEKGLAAVFEDLSSQPAGKATAHNHVHALKGWTKRMLRLLRREKTMSFNKYRELAGLPVITSFLELTGNNRTAEKLRSLYGQEDALELYPGLVIEKLDGISVIPPTHLNLLASWIHTAISLSPIGPPSTWRVNKDLFGDLEGFDEVENAFIVGLLRDNNGGRRASLTVLRPEDTTLPETYPACSFSLSNLSSSLVCWLMKNQLGFSFQAEMITAS